MGGEKFQSKTATCFCQMPQQNSFEVIRRLIRFIAIIDLVQNVPKDLLGQVGNVLELLLFDTRCCELRLDERNQIASSSSS
jgi:hypothetical protein